MAKKKDMLQEAMEAGQKGDLARAQELLRKLIEKNDKEALYWLLLSTVVESRDERVASLKHVLALEPNNSAALQDLKLLGVPLPTKATKSSKKQKNGNSPSPTKTPPAERKQEVEESRQNAGWSVGQLFGATALLLLGYLAANTGALVTPTDSSDSASSQIALATNVPAVQLGPGDLLEVTLTPTPLYVNTPHPESSSFQRGLEAYQEGEWLEAVDQFETHLARESVSAEAAYYLALAYFMLGDTDSANAAFEQSIAVNPQFAPAYLGRAEIQMELFQNSSAQINDLNTAILLDPNYTDAYLARAQYYLDRDEGELALDDIISAELLSPLSAEVHATKAVAYSELGNYDLALPAARLAYSLDLTILSNYPVLGKASLEMGQTDEAIEVMQRYLTFVSADAEAWQLLGIGYIQNGEELSALGAFNQALLLDPDLPQAAYFLGINELENGEVETAISFFRSAIRIAPNWFEARVALAEALLIDGNLEAAFFEVSFSRELVESDAQFAAVFFWNASILEALGEDEAAQRDWLNLLAIPEDSVPQEWRQLAELRTQEQ